MRLPVRLPVRLHVLTGLASAVFATASFGQAGNVFSPVLFGVLDANLRAVDNGSTRLSKALGTDGLTSSRFGFRGVEDLGDGLKAAFWLEASVAPDTGSVNAARFFSRRSTVALIDPALGEIRAGRDNTPAFNAYNAYDPFGTNGLGEILGNGTTIGILSTLGSGANTISRSDNQVSWFSPGTLGGAFAQLSVAPSEGATGNRLTAARIGFARKPYEISVVFSETKVAAGDKLKQALIGGFYDFDVVKVSGEVIQAKYGSLAGGPRRQRVYQVGAFVPMGRHIVRIDYIHGNMSGGAAGSGFGDADDASQYALGYEYQLSRRTSIYAVASTLNNRGASKLVVAAGNAGMLAGERSRGYDLGVRHSF